MPNQTDPNQNSSPNTAVGSPVPPTITPHADLPPLPPDFQSVSPNNSNVASVNDSSTAALPTEASAQAGPSDLPPMVTPPKKKFGGGRIIATILGLLLLVGGIGAGILLTQQPQLFQQKAACDSCTSDGQCNRAAGETCVSNCCTTTSAGHCGNGICDAGENSTNCPADCSGGGGKGLPACGPNLSCQASPFSTATACDGGGYTNYCCGSGQTIVNGACTNLATCGTGLSCGATGSSGTTACIQSGTTNKVYCCPAGQTYDEFKECFVPNPNSCTSDSQCTVPFQFCDRGTNQCAYSPNINCGRNTDTGAPVCCPPSVTAANCTGSNRVCEAPNRLECIVNGAYCTLDANGCTNKTPPPSTPPPAPQCNSQCTTSSQCPSGLVCNITPGFTNGFCRNPSCVDAKADCICTGTPPPGPTAVCQNITAYTSIWTPLTTAALSALPPSRETTVNFCVAGSASSGNFDRAKFTINGVVQAETTMVRPGSTDFCQAYTIPAVTATTTFNVTAQIHHVTLGWK